MLLMHAGKIDEAATKKVLDFSITRNVASMWLIGICLSCVFKRVGGLQKTLG